VYFIVVFLVLLPLPVVPLPLTLNGRDDVLFLEISEVWRCKELKQLNISAVCVNSFVIIACITTIAVYCIVFSLIRDSKFGETYVYYVDRLIVCRTDLVLFTWQRRKVTLT